MNEFMGVYQKVMNFHVVKFMNRMYTYALKQLLSTATILEIPYTY